MNPVLVNDMTKKIKLSTSVKLRVGCEDRASELKALWLRCTRVLRELGVDVDNAKVITVVNNRRRLKFKKQGNRLRFKAYYKSGGPEPIVGKTGSLLTRRIVVET